MFGRSLRWTESANADEDEYLLAALGSDGAAWKASQMRSAARIALLERDACDKVRRAMMRQAPTVIGEICPGTRIYFWSPHPMKGRMREDVHRWRGPATFVARESPGRYFVGWRGRVLLVAKGQMRYATAEETAAATVIAKDANLTAEQPQDKKA